MGRVGFRSGYINADNVAEGDLQFSSTEETVSVSFDEPLREDRTPTVLLTNREDPGGAGVSDPWVSTRSETGFTAKRATTGNAQDVSWLAVDQD